MKKVRCLLGFHKWYLLDSKHVCLSKRLGAGITSPQIRCKYCDKER